MKKTLLTIFALFIGFSASIFAQDKSKSMIQERIAYMKENLTLTGVENNGFWKVYEQYLNEEMKVMDTHRKNLAKQGIRLGPSGSNKELIASLSDKQVSYLQDQKFEMRKNLLNLEASYHKKFKAILSPKHLQSMYDLEFKYKRELTKKKKEEAKEAKGPINSGKKRR